MNAMPKTRTTRIASSAEMQIMNVLWSEGEMEQANIAKIIYGEVNDSICGTVITLLYRLQEKGLVEMERACFSEASCAICSRRTKN